MAIFHLPRYLGGQLPLDQNKHGVYISNIYINMDIFADQVTPLK